MGKKVYIFTNDPKTVDNNMLTLETTQKHDATELFKLKITSKMKSSLVYVSV